MMGACLTTDFMFIVMEFMDQGSLFDVLRNQMLDLSPTARLRLAVDSFQGLRFLHLQNPPPLHKDIKSLNILVDSHLKAKLADFGLSTIRVGVTREGSLPWTAPEVLKEQPYTKAADIYSLGWCSGSCSPSPPGPHGKACLPMSSGRKFSPERGLQCPPTRSLDPSLPP